MNFQADARRGSIKDLRDHIQSLRADRNARLDRAIREFDSGLLEMAEFREEKKGINREIDSQIAILEDEVMSLLHPERATSTSRSSAAHTPARTQRAVSPDWDEGEMDRDLARATSPALPAEGM